MVRVAFTSKKGKAEKERIKEKILADHLEQITADGFDPKSFNYEALRTSDPVWNQSFEKKQFRETITNLISKMMKDHESATTEEDELFGQRRSSAGTDDDIANGMADLSVEEEDPRRVTFPKNHEKFSDPTTDDEYFQLLVQIPHGVWQVSIDTETKEIVIKVRADGALWDFRAFRYYMGPQLNNFHGGLRLAAFSKAGRRLIGEDAANTDMILLEDRVPIPFAPEANFYTGAGGFGIFDTLTVNGNRVVMVQCIKQRTNQQDTNENIQCGYGGQAGYHPFPANGPHQQQQQQQQHGPPPPQQPYQAPQNQQPPPYVAPPQNQQQHYQQQQQHYSAPPQNQQQNYQQQQQQQQHSAPSPMQTSPYAEPPMQSHHQQRQMRTSTYSQQQQQQLHKPPPKTNTNMHGDWRQATGVAYAPGVDPNNRSFTPPPPPPPPQDLNVPPVNLFPNTPQNNHVYVETVAEEDEEEEEDVVVDDSKPSADGNTSDTNPQSGTWTGGVAEAISNVMRRSKRKTPPSATSSTQEPHAKIQFASDSPYY